MQLVVQKSTHIFVLNGTEAYICNECFYRAFPDSDKLYLTCDSVQVGVLVLIVWSGRVLASETGWEGHGYMP